MTKGLASKSPFLEKRKKRMIKWTLVISTVISIKSSLHSTTYHAVYVFIGNIEKLYFPASTSIFLHRIIISLGNGRGPFNSQNNMVAYTPNAIEIITAATTTSSSYNINCTKFVVCFCCNKIRWLPFCNSGLLKLPMP